jgi:hypothetical protein
MAELASDTSSNAEAIAEELPESPPESAAAAEGAGVETTLPLDQVFSVLKNERRRRVLELLQDADGTVSLSDLAEEIAAMENDKEVAQITSSERKRVYVGLYQCHLPKMDSMGVVSFNKPRGLIELGENVDVFYEYLDTADESEPRPWHRYSLWLSLAGAGVLGTALVAGRLMAAPVVDATVGLTIAAFLLYAAVGLYSRRETDEE